MTISQGQNPSKTILDVSGLSAGYGELLVVRNASFTVSEGEVVAILGPNGAGKSTTLKSLLGTVRLVSGSVLLDGTEVAEAPTHEVVGRGLVLVPEGRRLFPQMTIHENLMLGGYRVKDRQRRSERVAELTELFPILRDRLHYKAGGLSGGEQQMLAIARGLVSSPRMLMLDEPSLGLAPVVQRQVAHLIEQLRALGQSVLLVEQNVDLAFRTADRAYLMKSGRIALEGPISELEEDGAIRSEYFIG